MREGALPLHCPSRPLFGRLLKGRAGLELKAPTTKTNVVGHFEPNGLISISSSCLQSAVVMKVQPLISVGTSHATALRCYSAERLMDATDPYKGHKNVNLLIGDRTMVRLVHLYLCLLSCTKRPFDMSFPVNSDFRLRMMSDGKCVGPGRDKVRKRDSLQQSNTFLFCVGGHGETQLLSSIGPSAKYAPSRTPRSAPQARKGSRSFLHLWQHVSFSRNSYVPQPGAEEQP